MRDSDLTPKGYTQYLLVFALICLLIGLASAFAAATSSSTAGLVALAVFAILATAALLFAIYQVNTRWKV